MLKSNVIKFILMKQIIKGVYMDEMNVLETNEPNSVQTIIKVTFDGNIYS